MQELYARRSDLASAEAKASGTFNAEALRAPITELQERFTHLHRGLKKLSSGYRSDKQLVAGLLRDARSVKVGIEHLADAAAWGDALRSYDAATVRHRESVGRYWNGPEVAYDRIAAAFSVAEEALRLSGTDIDSGLADYLSGASPDAAPQAIVDSVRQVFSTWRTRMTGVSDPLARPQLLTSPIQDSVAWLTAHVDPMRRAADRIAAVGAVTGRARTLRDVDSILQLVEAARESHDTFGAGEDSFRATLGDGFDFERTDLERLDAGLAWTERVRALAGGALSDAQIKTLEGSHRVGGLADLCSEWESARRAVLGAFDVTKRTDLPGELDDYGTAFDLIEALREDTVGQQEWFEYRAARSALAEHGLDAAIDFCVKQRLAADDVPNVLDKAILRAWAEDLIYTDGRLSPALTQDREALVAEYRDMDRQLIAAAASDIIRAANARRPANTQIGEPAVIRREGGKQRRHMPVRDLIAKARTTVTAVKPVFMMSPLAVSQYLPQDMQFDVVICDEASQVTPGNAINCIYRGRALILAGDDKQLPPTSFFEHVVDDEDDDTDVRDFQSVLELTKSCGAFNNLGLRWHYRSRHESLIAYSNYKFYEGKLITYPSSHSDGKDVGVAFFHSQGTYRRGGPADNPGEARMVAERVMQHFTDRPELSLGVVTFSVAQADAVQLAVDEARESRRDLDRFFDGENRLDGFFVRSLESVQGDERDVVIMSVGYGPDEAGKVTTNFGVLNRDRGWRRLNVAVTRARQRVEVVASMKAGDIPPSTNENVEYLRQYLDYADRGVSTLAVAYSSTGLEPESPFEESVIETIRGWGYAVEPQVGSAGFRIDIGIRHPAHPGVFSLGVECDGFQYHSAPAARDRDRLRDQILGGLGWRLHRIWGTAWYRDRPQEEGRLRRAIEEANAASADGRIRQTGAIHRPPVRTETVEQDDVPRWVSEYEVAEPVELPYWVDPAEPGNELHMVKGLVAIAKAEGPVHIDVVHQRIRGWWNIGRVTQNVRENVRRAIESAPIVRNGDFIDTPDHTTDRVRTASRLFSRTSEQIHLDELALAVQFLLRDVGAATDAEVIQQVARVFGWQRTGPLIDARPGKAIERAVQNGSVERRDGSLTSMRS